MRSDVNGGRAEGHGPGQDAGLRISLLWSTTVEMGRSRRDEFRVAAVVIDGGGRMALLDPGAVTANGWSLID